MADSPVRLLVKIGDPTTAANEAAVDASGNLSVIAAANDGVDIGDVGVADFAAALTDSDDDIVAFAQTTLRTIGMMYASDGSQWERLTSDGSGALDVNVTLALPVGANTIGDVTISGDALTSLQLIDDAIFVDDTATHATGTTKGMGIMAVAVPTDAAVDANDIAMPAMSLDRRLHVDADITASVALDVSAATVTVDLGANNDVTIEGGAVVGTDGGAGPADCLSVGGTEAGGNIQELLVDATGALQVDVLSGGGESTPTGQVAVRATATDVAVDATINVDEADAGGTTSKCRGFDASSSVPIKAELQSVVDGAATPIVTLFAQAGEPIHWRAPHRDYFETAFGANAGFDGWRVVITNKDSTDAADVYGTIYTEN